MSKSLRPSRIIARSKHGAAYIGVETETQFGPEPERPENVPKITSRPWRRRERQQSIGVERIYLCFFLTLAPRCSPQRHRARSVGAMPVDPIKREAVCSS